MWVRLRTRGPRGRRGGELHVQIGEGCGTQRRSADSNRLVRCDSVHGRRSRWCPPTRIPRQQTKHRAETCHKRTPTTHRHSTREGTPRGVNARLTQTHALAIPERLSPSGPRSPIDNPSSRNSLMKGTLSLAGKLLKLIKTFAFEKGIVKRPAN